MLCILVVFSSQADPKIPKAVLALLKKGVRDETSMSIQVNAVSTLFRMLDVFAERHDPYAPFVYKARLYIDNSLRCCGAFFPRLLCDRWSLTLCVGLLFSLPYS